MPTPATPSNLTNTRWREDAVNSEEQNRLYREVSVTRPSKSLALRQAHIGPQNILQPHWWPLSMAYVDGYQHDSPFDSSMKGPFIWVTGSLDATHLLYGCQDRAAWALNRPPRGCREAAIRRAITAAEG